MNRNLLKELGGKYRPEIDWMEPFAMALECWDLRHLTELNAKETDFLSRVIDDSFDNELSHLELEWLSAIYNRLSALEERHFEQLRQQQLKQQRALGEAIISVARKRDDNDFSDAA